MSHTYWKELFQDNNIVVASKGYKTSQDEYDNSFLVITSGGVKKQGEIMPVLYATPDLAWKAFESTLLAWLKGRRQLHVRSFPELVELKMFQDELDREWTQLTYYAVACRITAY